MQTKGMQLSWSTWIGLAGSLLATLVTQYVLVLNRITAVEVRQDYVAKDVEKSELRATSARSEMLAAISNLRADIARSTMHPYEAARPASEPPAPAPPE